MGTRARGFLLFSFAFSSVLSLPEIGGSLENAHAKWNASSGSSLNNITNNNKIAIKRVYIPHKSLTHPSGVNIAKREISNSLNNKIGSFESPRDKIEPGKRGSFPANVNVFLNSGKRARVGFTGMRGKKEGFLSGNYFGKRNSLKSGDLKRRWLNEFLDLVDKKSRTGLSGMRGKKYDDYYDKLREMIFHWVREKKNLYGPYEKGAVEWNSFPRVAEKEREIFDDGLEKRTRDFHSMGGRSQHAAKRDPLAFQETGNDVYGYDFNRALGFLGMRGKKTPENWVWSNNSKRRTQSGYFETKGKKAQSGFFGMRGKKSLSGYLQAHGKFWHQDRIGSIQRNLKAICIKEDKFLAGTKRPAACLATGK